MRVRGKVRTINTSMFGRLNVALGWVGYRRNFSRVPEPFVHSASNKIDASMFYPTLFSIITDKEAIL